MKATIALSILVVLALSGCASTARVDALEGRIMASEQAFKSSMICRHPLKSLSREDLIDIIEGYRDLMTLDSLKAIRVGS